MQFCTKKKLITYIASAAGATTVSVIAYYFILAASGVGPEAPFPPSAPAHSSPQSGCVYLKGNSGAVDILGCGDGTRCNATSDGWACCGRYERTLCPVNMPQMCEATSCGDGHHCCEQDCSDKGGNRTCHTPFPPPSYPPGVPSECPQRPPPPPQAPPPPPPPPPSPSFPPQVPYDNPQRPPPPPQVRRRSARRRSARRRSARRRHLKAQLLMTRRGTRRATSGLGPAEMKTINKFSKLRANLSKMPKPHRPIISGASD